MNRRNFLGLLGLTACNDIIEDMNINKKNWWLSGADNKWWLGGGAIPESTDYTIYDPASASDEANSFINIANPGVRDAVKSGTVTFTQNVGWTGNGTTGYLDTQTFVSQTSTIIVMYRDAQSGRYIFGVLQASPNRTFSIVPQSSTNVGWEVAGTFTSTASRHLGGAIAATTAKGYRNGIVDTSANFVWSGAQTTRSIKLLAYDNGSILGYNNGTIHRVAIYNITLSDAQIEAATNEMMKIGEGTFPTSYYNKVIALNPSLYLPLNVKSGYVFMKDYSGNKIVTGYTNAGQWVGDGESLTSATPTATTQIYPNVNTNYNNLRNFDLDECTISMQVNLSYSSPFNQKICEIWRTGLNEYIAYEIRSTNVYGLFTRTNGVNQDSSSLFTGTTGWHTVTMYNSVSNGVMGMYYDGVKYEVVKTAGATVTRTNQLFEIGAMIGSIKNICVFPRLLTDEEVNTLV